MIYNNIEFHNVDHLQKVEGVNGLRLERFPEEFRNNLGIKENSTGRFRAGRAHGCELRFVTESDYFDLALTAMESSIDILIYCGDRIHSKYTLEDGKCSVLHITKHEICKIVDMTKLVKDRFESNVWRVLIGLNGSIFFNYLDTFGHDCRVPNINEKPAVKWAAYGSSITCGSVTKVYSNSYINQAAIRLGYDVLNKGLSGTSYCENFVAGYLSQLDVDIITLELGVNMVLLFEEEEFEKRVYYMLKKILSNPNIKKIFAIDMFPNKGEIYKDEMASYYRHYRSFKKIVRRLVNEIEDERLINIPGECILNDFNYLSVDLLHPSDDGHIMMGENLARLMKDHIEQ